MPAPPLVEEVALATISKPPQPAPGLAHPLVEPVETTAARAGKSLATLAEYVGNPIPSV